MKTKTSKVIVLIIFLALTVLTLLGVQSLMAAALTIMVGLQGNYETAIFAAGQSLASSVFLLTLSVGGAIGVLVTMRRKERMAH